MPDPGEFPLRRARNGRGAARAIAADTLDLAGCGSMVVDTFYRTPRIIRAEEKVALHAHRADGAIEQTEVGGLVLNHLGWARILGLETGIFGKIGPDRPGEFLRQGMERLGIQHHLTTDGSASAFARIFVDSDGGRAIYMARGATAELSPDEIRRLHATFIRRARMVTTEISQLPLRTVIALLVFARAHSIPTVLDVDIPPSDACPVLGTRAEYERALRLATILKPSKSSAREIIGAGGDALRMAEAIRARYGNRAVVITDGEHGCAIAARGTALHVPAFETAPVDTTGAGDAFLGAMAAGLRWGLGWHATGVLANAAGAICVRRLGAFPTGFELRAEIIALFKSVLPDHPLPESATIPAETPRMLDPAVEAERFMNLCVVELNTLRTALDLNRIREAVALIRAREAGGGRVHLTGVGKPEHVAHYAASLLCSVGTQATFLHATETLHGSLGQVDPRDVVIAISRSGNTRELCEAAAAVKDHGAELIAVTGNPNSELSRLADLVIHTPVEHEGGILGLAPRVSVIAEICVLAALSVALEAERGLTPEQYSRWHRGGSLGETARRIISGRPAARKPGPARR